MVKTNAARVLDRLASNDYSLLAALLYKRTETPDSERYHRINPNVIILRTDKCRWDYLSILEELDVRSAGQAKPSFVLNNWTVTQCRFSGCMIRTMASPGHESESLNRPFLVDSMTAMIHAARLDGYFDYLNRRWLEYLGVISNTWAS
jgi:hypothetical protein